MGFAQLWDLSFTAFEVFIGVGILWMMFVEPRLPSRDMSVPLMTGLALLVAAAVWVVGWRKAQRTRIEGQKQIDAATAHYEEEVG
jgi:hypothetical protein